MAVQAQTVAGSNVVRVGSTVRVHGDDGVSEFVIVESADADASAGRVSSESPMGRAVLGRTLGQMAQVRAPGGVRLVRVVAIGHPVAEVSV
jgi:transcription elongation factor GreA